MLSGSREPYVQQIRHDHHIQQECQHPQPGNMCGNLEDLQGNVGAPGNDREPLGPSSHVPQSIRFHEPDDGIEERQSRECLQARIASPRRGVDEDTRVMSCRIQMPKAHDFFSDGLQVMMNQVQQPEADQQYEEAF